jgi:hypothetical protein
MRSFEVKNISFENLTQTDLFARGWHRSGYLFDIEGADTDGWVDGKLSLRFPATTQFKEAIIQVIRYPSKRDYPLAVTVDGKAEPDQVLGLDQTETVRVPLSAVSDTVTTLAASERYPLGAPDTRTRSYRVVNIDFD